MADATNSYGFSQHRGSSKEAGGSADQIFASNFLKIIKILNFLTHDSEKALVTSHLTVQSLFFFLYRNSKIFSSLTAMGV